MRATLAFAVGLVALTAPFAAEAGPQITDVSVGYSFMRISDVTIAGRQSEPVFLRHNLDVGIGIENLSLGLVFQRADKTAATETGEPENGLMLKVGYDQIVLDWLRLESAARLALSAGTDSSQPLYATDTDLTLKLVLFDAAGWGAVDRPIFPTAFLGSIVNRFGRVQLTGGVGVWWWGFSAFVSGLYSLNGVDDPMLPAPGERGLFAAIDNAGVTTSVGYDLDITSTSQMHFEVRRNFAIRNAGDDFVAIVRWRHYFDPLEGAF